MIMSMILLSNIITYLLFYCDIPTWVTSAAPIIMVCEHRIFDILSRNPFVCEIDKDGSMWDINNRYNIIIDAYYIILLILAYACF